MKRITLATLLCLAAPLASQAADTEGNFAVKGAGLATCEAFLKERESKTNYYFMFGGWLDGYVTAVNQLVPETFDVAPWESTDALAALIENHCRRNPEDNFFMVANALAGTLMRDRLQESSEPVEAKVGSQRIMLYKSVMRRVQEKLKAEGHLSGGADGLYGPNTRQALESYQKAENIPVTGLPDQLTLLKMFRSNPAAATQSQ